MSANLIRVPRIIRLLFVAAALQATALAAHANQIIFIGQKGVRTIFTLHKNSSDPFYLAGATG